MRTLLLVGSIAAGVLLFVYEWYNSRENGHEEGHGGRPPTYPAGDFLEINETRPKLLGARKLPGPDERCSVCLEALVKKDEAKKYCIIALPKCGHWFHQKCAVRLLEYHPSCPVCREPIDSSVFRRTPVRVIESDEEVQIVSADTDPRPSTSDDHPRRSKKD